MVGMEDLDGVGAGQGQELATVPCPGDHRLRSGDKDITDKTGIWHLRFL